MSRGGARTGSGRKRLAEKREHRISVGVTAAEMDILTKFQELSGKEPAQVLRGLLDDWLKHSRYLK